MAIISNKKLRIFKVLNILNWIFVVISIGGTLNAIAIIVGLYGSYYDFFLVIGGFLSLAFLGLYQLIIMIVYGFNLKLLNHNANNWYLVYWLMVVFSFILFLIYYCYLSTIAFNIMLVIIIAPILICLYFSRAMSKINELE